MPEVSGRGVWRVLREQRDRRQLGVDIVLAVPRDARVAAVGAIKGCFDGIISSFQLCPRPLGPSHRKLPETLPSWTGWQSPLSSEELERLLCGEVGEEALFTGSPFGSTNLSPCDERWVYADRNLSLGEAAVTTGLRELSRVNPQILSRLKPGERKLLLHSQESPNP